MKMPSRVRVSLTIAILLTGCANASFKQIGASVLSSTGYVDASQAESVFSIGEHLVKSQEELTPEQEYYLGRAVSARLLATYPLRKGEALERYVNKVGNIVVSASDLPETFGGYHFVVVDSPAINAFSAPGGFVFISLGFLNLISSEDELAAVLAHEVAHIVKRHGVGAVSNDHLFAALTDASQQGLTEAGGAAGAPVEIGALTSLFSESVTGVVDTLLTKGFDRKQEYQADLYAAQLLQRAGYDPRALLDVLGALEREASSGSEGWFSTHPTADRRLAAVRGDFTFPDRQPEHPVRKTRFAQVVK
jgi:predicted Zn-dependent protease